MMRRVFSRNIAAVTTFSLGKQECCCFCCFPRLLSTTEGISQQQQRTIRNALDLDDDENDCLFTEALRRQQAQQQQQKSETTTTTNSRATNQEVVSDEERREKTKLFLRAVVDAGVVGTDASTSSPEAALLQVQDMITAAVKLGRLTPNHIRRMFAMSGERQREDPGREMWIRMLTVVKTTIDAERDLFFSNNSIYAPTENNDQHGEETKSSQRRLLDAASKSAVEPAAWNALIGLCLEFVVRKRAHHESQSGSFRAVLESELEMLLGSGRAMEPHWWIAGEMDRRRIPIANPAVVAFLEAEVTPENSTCAAGGRTSAAARQQQQQQQQRREPAVQLSEGEKQASKLKPELKQAVLESRTKLLQRLRNW